MEAASTNSMGVCDGAGTFTTEECRLRSGVSSGRLSLNAFDLFNSSNYTSQVFVYRGRLDTDLLKKTLQRVLSYFPAFTGRLATTADGTVEVALDDSGVPFEVRQSSLGLSDYWHRGCESFTTDSTLSHQFTQYKVSAAAAPPLALRVTHLQDGASVLGVTHFHGITDYAGLFVFLKAWSSTIGHHIFKKPEFDRSRINRLAAGKDGANPSGEEPLVSVDLADLAKRVARLRAEAKLSKRGVIRLNPAKLRAIKREALAGKRPLRWVSAQDFLVAHVWRSIVSARPGVHATALSYVIDLRACYGMDISQEYIGNATATRLVGVDPETLVNGALLHTAEQVRAACDRVDVNSVGTDLAFLTRQFAMKRRLFVLKSILDESTFFIPVNNFSKMPIYQIDLGVGAPIWYGAPENDNLPRLVHIVPAPEDDAGVDVHLKLPGDELDHCRCVMGDRETEHHA